MFFNGTRLRRADDQPHRAVANGDAFGARPFERERRDPRAGRPDERVPAGSTATTRSCCARRAGRPSSTSSASRPRPRGGVGHRRSTSTADNTLRRKASVTDGDRERQRRLRSRRSSGTASRPTRSTGSARTTSDPPPVADAAPSVATRVPANGAADVATRCHTSVTFSEPVSVTAAFAISCATSGAHVPALGGDGDVHARPGHGFRGRGDVHGHGGRPGGDGRRHGRSAGHHGGRPHLLVHHRRLVARIFQIRGRARLTAQRPAGRLRRPGVITAVRPNSFTMQDAVGDGTIATSDAILVFRPASARRSRSGRRSSSAAA